MTEYKDGPVSHLFSPLPLRSGIEMEKLRGSGLSPLMLNALDYAPSGSCISWGIPFEITDPVLIKDQPVSLDRRVELRRARYLSSNSRQLVLSC